MADRTYVFTCDELFDWYKKHPGWPYEIVRMDQGVNGLIYTVEVWEQIADEESLNEIRIWRIRHGNR